MAHFPKPYSWPKCTIFPTDFKTWPKFDTLYMYAFMSWLLNQDPVSDLPYNQFPSSGLR